jgi:predicted RNA binding protein with dsRBD fold (UPF0201 family)
LNILAEISSDVHPTEDTGRVERAVLNIFPQAKIEHADRCLRAFVNSLEGFEKLRMLIRSRRIRAAARAVLMKGVKDDTVVFYLNKQAAYVGKVSFFEEGETVALGPIKVVVKTDDPMKFVEWLTEY